MGANSKSTVSNGAAAHENGIKVADG
jgi:hypothetical protein